MEDKDGNEDKDKDEEDEEGEITPRLEKSFDTGFQLPRAKKPCDCLHTPAIKIRLIYWL